MERAKIVPAPGRLGLQSMYFDLGDTV